MIHDGPAERREPRPSPVDAAASAGDDGRADNGFNLLEQHPRAAIAHAHCGCGSPYRSRALDAFEKPRFAGPECRVIFEVDPNHQPSHGNQNAPTDKNRPDPRAASDLSPLVISEQISRSYLGELMRLWRSFALVTALAAIPIVAAQAADVTVFAAASLSDALSETGKAYEHETGKAVVFSFAA